MATLNVRDRVIEAKIAYVGIDLSGHTGPLEQLRRVTPGGHTGALEEQTVGGGQLVSFDWRPSGLGQFNDCDVSVKLVGTQGEVAQEEVQRVLVDADGLVLVIDSDPAAQEHNRRSLAAVREALANDGAKVRPVVVQVNKREPSDAVPAGEVAGALGVAAWPQVSASTVSGEGVVEALERATSLVIDAIKAPADEPALRPRGDVGPRAEGNPLLAALRQILQATVAEHVAVLEERLAARIDERLAARGDVARELAMLESTVAASGAASFETLRAALAEESARARLTIDALRDRVVSTQRGLDELRAGYASTESAVGERLTRAEQTMEAAFARIEAIAQAAPAACTKEELDACTARMLDEVALGRDAVEQEMRAQRTALRDELGAEVVRAVGVRARSDRDALVAAVAAVERHLDAVRAEVKGTDPRTVVSDVAGAVDRLSQLARVLMEKVDALLKLIEPTAGTLRAIRERLNGVHTELHEALDVRIGESLAAVHDSLRALRTGADRGFALADERTAEVRTELFELLDALKNQKRSWFR